MVNFFTKYAGVVALVIVLAQGIATAVLPLPEDPQYGAAPAANLTRISNPWTFSSTATFTGAVTMASTTITSHKTGQTGTQTSGANWGSCNILSSSNTISATTTATVDCAGGTGNGTALAGITAGDNVTLQQGTTTSTVWQGMTILGASASSTSGFITLKLYNSTGGTFTWTTAASSSFRYTARR